MLLKQKYRFDELHKNEEQIKYAFPKFRTERCQERLQFNLVIVSTHNCFLISIEFVTLSKSFDALCLASVCVCVCALKGTERNQSPNVMETKFRVDRASESSPPEDGHPLCSWRRGLWIFKSPLPQTRALFLSLPSLTPLPFSTEKFHWRGP